MMAKYDQANPPALRKLLADGAKLHGFSPPIMEACLKAARELHAEVAATNPDFKKVYESLRLIFGNGYQWFQVAEVGYDNFMARHSPELIAPAQSTGMQNPGARSSGAFVCSG